MQIQLSATRNSPLGDARRTLVRAFSLVGLFSIGVSLLLLAGPLYMLQIYDRVIPTGHVDTLLVLSAILVGAFAVLAALDALRALVAQRLGLWLERRLSGPVLAASAQAALLQPGVSAQGLRDVATLRGYLGSPAVFPLFDAPMAPFFLAILFLIHPLLGAVALIGGAVLFALALLNEWLTRRSMVAASGAALASYEEADRAIRNADALAAMGMLPALAQNLERKAEGWRRQQHLAGGRSASLGAIAKGLRLLLQSLSLGVGAWLVVQGELTAGTIIAASIMTSRALAPVEQAIGAWHGLVNAQAAWRRLDALLDAHGGIGRGTRLPRPSGHLQVQDLVYAPAGAEEPLLRGLSVSIEPGTVVGLIGPTGAGKSSLARLMVGSLAPLRGSVRLDGAEMSRWDPCDRGRHVGYLPQDVELLDETVRANIARLSEASDEAVVAAAQLAGAHEMILRLPQGYETPIGRGGLALSGGQRQKIGLARALFGAPRLLVLDEPNAHLDSDGEMALTHCLAALKDEGCAVIMVCHKPSLLAAANKILVLREGRVAAYDDSQEIIRKFTPGSTQSVQPAQSAQPSQPVVQPAEPAVRRLAAQLAAQVASQ